jgi:N-acetylglucosamine kinase-like BadF-type ATPase
VAKKFNRIWIDAGGTHVRAIGETGKRRVTLFDVSTTPWAVQTAMRRARGWLNSGGDIAVGMRGVWRPAEKAAWKRKLKAGRVNLHVMSDIELAHAMAFADGVGIVLNAGTGSIAYGRNAKGKIARAGGLGPLMGDEGSAFWIGLEYVRRVEGKRLGFSKMRKLAVGPNPVAAIAARAKLALKAARRGGEAKKIIQEAQTALIALVRSVQSQLGGKRLPVALRGGLFEDAGFFRSMTRRRP